MIDPLPTDRLKNHLEELGQLEKRAREAMVRRRFDEAAAWVQTSATYAWLNHCGIFASPVLEGILEDIARRTTSTSRPPSTFMEASRPRLPKRILHVATQLYPTGGHTQAIRCWAEQDRGREHRLVLTRQGPTPIPDKIRQITSFSSSRNAINQLDRRPGGLLARSARLRKAVGWADLVILHTHNYDVVPTLALHAWPASPPTVLVDSNDHTFWIGRSAASLVMHMRESGQELGITRRGLGAEDSFVLERPLQLPRRTASRADAKRRLGMDPQQVVIGTAADPTKYRPVSGTSFLDLMVPVLRAHPDAVLLAAGPARDEGMWQDANVATNGRVRALGLLHDMRPFHQAADIYLDSFPFASLTSLLESGSLGNPTVTYRGHPREADVLGADTRGLDDLMCAPTNPHAFHHVLSELVGDPEHRRQLGERTAERIVATHTGAGWLERTEAMYLAAAARPERIVPGSMRGDSEVDVLVDLVMKRTGLATGMQGAVTANAGLLPARARLLALLERSPELNLALARCVLSEWEYTWLSLARRNLYASSKAARRVRSEQT